MRIRGIPWSAAISLLWPRPLDFLRSTHVFLCVCDHYEPMWRRPSRHVQDGRVERWVREYPRIAGQFHDCLGRNPQHTFFYPQDEYDADHVEQIAGLCRQGFGDMEIHLHHRHDTSDSLREKLQSFAEVLHGRHGMLRRDESGRLTYGFIHGNWALDNSRPDRDWCGVNDEISVLLETGCYADFTMPSAPDGCQTQTVNSIYYAVDDPERPKSHDNGVAARVGATPPQNSLLMIQGPLGFDWTDRKWGFLPRIENSDLTGNRPPTAERFRLWCRTSIGVAGRPDWIFVKLHTHGAQEANSAMFLGEAMQNFHTSLREIARVFPEVKYYYVTARELGDLVHQAEKGHAQPEILGNSAVGHQFGRRMSPKD